ncbi:MAG: hypothetical protein ACTHLN_13005 [Tepidisphaeraceae bacterium]
MDLYTGEIKGKVTLDKSGFKQDVASVVRDATEAADKLTETLGKPFAPAAEEAGKLKQGLEAVAQQSAAAMQGASGLATALEAVASTPAKQSLQAIAQESSAAAQSAGGLQIALEKVASASVLPPATYGLKELQAEVQKTEVDTRRLPLALADVATASVKVTPAIYD